MTPQQLNLLAVVALAVCWGAFGLAWFAGAIYNQTRAPQERVRTGPGTWGTAWIVAAVVWIAVPRAAWSSWLAEFPDEYPRYRRRVPRLVPGLRLLGRHRVASE